MTNNKESKTKFQNLSPLEAIHEAAEGLYSAKIINGQTMRNFDELCLPEIRDLKPREIKRIRLEQRVSQGVFAKYLNTSASTIRQWESGDKHPRGISLKILNLVDAKGIEILL